MTVGLTLDEEIHFDSPRDFLANFRKSDVKWCAEEAWSSNWVFRGVTNSNYNLKPSAWRYWDLFQKGLKSEQYFDLYEYLMNTKTRTLKGDVDSFCGKQLETTGCRDRDLFYKLVYCQYYFEYWLIEKFGGHLNDLGHIIPGTHPREEDYRFERSPSDQFYIPTLFGIAQHHGIPTRYLDWTFNPLKAIYFAAQKGVKFKPNVDLAVWAMDLENEIADEVVEIRVVPRGHVTFLHAQEGLFSTVANPLPYVRENLEWPSLEKIIPSRLRKYTIASKHSFELLRLINMEGVNQHTLMPTLDNAAKSLINVLPSLVAQLKKLE